MIQLVPKYSETITTHLPAKSIINGLRAQTVEDLEKEFKESVGVRFKRKFNGTVEKNSFKISRVIKQPNNFNPIICGQVEDAKRGAIIFLKYKLFKVTNWYLVLWTFISTIATLFFVFSKQDYLYATLSCSLGLVNYIVTYLSFKKEIENSRKVLQQCIDKAEDFFEDHPSDFED